MKLRDKITQLKQRLETIKLKKLAKDIPKWEQVAIEALDLKLSEIYGSFENELLKEQEEAFDLAEWGINLGIPLSRIFKRRFFYNSNFSISPFVLDPRPETEALVEYIIGLKPRSVLDLGTGSGCILLSILQEVDNCRGIGVDLSPKAIENASENAILSGFYPKDDQQKNIYVGQSNNSLELITGDFANTYGKFEVVVANPPYIPKEKLSFTDKSALTDPALALFDNVKFDEK